LRCKVTVLIRIMQIFLHFLCCKTINSLIKSKLQINRGDSCESPLFVVYTTCQLASYSD
jgi:hypothetical protein